MISILPALGLLLALQSSPRSDSTEVPVRQNACNGKLMETASGSAKACLGIYVINLGQIDLKTESFFADLERRAHREDRAAVLDGVHVARGEALAVANAVDLVDDRCRRITGSQEVRVQRVHEARRAVAGRVIDRAGRGDERLACDLATEHALALLVG